MNNPTRASSEAPGHSGRLANDGNPATFWQAAAGDTNAWLQRGFGTHRDRQPNRSLTFPTDGNWRYKIEISSDGETNWKLLVDQTQTADSSAVRADAVPGNSIPGRFVRVSITGSPVEQSAALAEVQFSGTQAAP